MATLSIRLSDEIERSLDQEAQYAGANRSEVAREAIVEYLDRQRYKRFMAEVVDEARQLKGDPETLRLVEEWLPIDNEAMELAEGGRRGPAESEDEEPWWR